MVTAYKASMTAAGARASTQLEDAASASPRPIEECKSISFCFIANVLIVV